jgi:glycosyltransferase involved in cell wall biosynthesis
LAITGLGTLWLSNEFLSVCARATVRWIVRFLVARGALAVFENHDDPAEFGLEAKTAQAIVVPGAGVSEADFSPTSEPASPPVKFAVLSRMLRTKGIAETVDAARALRAQGIAAELHLFGGPDPTNRDSFDERELRAFSAEPNVFWHGPTADVARVWRDHHVAMLPSYREGLPRALVEAAAAARPIIATDVPGCREVVRDGIEGLLVAPRESAGVAAAMKRLAGDPRLRLDMGTAGHRRFKEEFTESRVLAKIGALYRSLL